MFLNCRESTQAVDSSSSSALTSRSIEALTGAAVSLSKGWKHIDYNNTQTFPPIGDTCLVRFQSSKYPVILAYRNNDRWNFIEDEINSKNRASYGRIFGWKNFDDSIFHHLEEHGPKSKPYTHIKGWIDVKVVLPQKNRLVLLRCQNVAALLHYSNATYYGISGPGEHIWEPDDLGHPIAWYPIIQTPEERLGLVTADISQPASGRIERKQSQERKELSVELPGVANTPSLSSERENRFSVSSFSSAAPTQYGSPSPSPTLPAKKPKRQSLDRGAIAMLQEAPAQPLEIVEDKSSKSGCSCPIL